MILWRQYVAAPAPVVASPRKVALAKPRARPETVEAEAPVEAPTQAPS